MKAPTPTVYRNSTAEHFDVEGQYDLSCEVRISGDSLAVSFKDEEDGGFEVYEGRETEPGHFQLTCPKKNGRANLHRFANADVLVGWWLQEGQEGLWRITLKK